ncbi:histidinol dehydrogenase, partial [Sphingobium sp. ba1]|uniref:histidinol dehydrogenase n=1 Tax=Sphingobium sp. ba1 TaxID=1522072 RepID=UPI0018731463
MTQRLATTSPDFAAAFTTLVDARREADEDVSRDVTAILKAVRAGGDAALADYTQRFDRHDLNVSGWAVTPAECRAALEGISTTLRDALELAAARITTYHEKQRPVDSDSVDSAGVRLGARWSAVDAAGLYVPGGRAAYPSSL